MIKHNQGNTLLIENKAPMMPLNSPRAKQAPHYYLLHGSSSFCDVLAHTLSHKEDEIGNNQKDAQDAISMLNSLA
jgi:hypothetical protein